MENNENYPLGGMLEPYDIEREITILKKLEAGARVIENALNKEQQAEITEKIAKDIVDYE